MQYRKYGKTEEMVSTLALGAMRLPLLPGRQSWQIDEMRSIELIRHAIDSGVNYIDTAYGYHPAPSGNAGMSEPLVGKALENGYRQKTFLASKLPPWYANSREDMDRLLNEQLSRLGTDHIDFYLAHSLQAATWKKMYELGICEFLDQAKKDGRIRHAGFSFHDEYPVFLEIINAYDWEFCQIQYNYLDEEYQAGRKGMDLAVQRGMGLAVMEPLRGGKLSSLPLEASEGFRRIHPDWSASAWGLRWMWNHPQVSVALSGMSNMEQLEENLRTADQALPNALGAEELQAVAAARDYINGRQQVNCTGCEYCMPCPAGVSIPGCFAQYNAHYMFGQDVYPLLIEKGMDASKCVGCNQCLEKCPQSIPIPDRLADIKRCFENV